MEILLRITEKTIAKLSAPAQAEIGSTIILDGSGSQNFQKLEIIQTSGQNVDLQNIASDKCQFICPQQEMNLGFQLKLSKDMIESRMCHMKEKLFSLELNNQSES